MIGSVWFADIPSSRTSFRFIIIAVLIFLGVSTVAQAFTQIDAGFGSFSLTSVSGEPRPARSENRRNNAWWGVLWAKSVLAARIHEFSSGAQNWSRTWTNVDGRNFAGNLPQRIENKEANSDNLVFPPGLPPGAQTATLKTAGYDPDNLQVDETAKRTAADVRPLGSDVVHEEVQVGGSARINSVTTSANLTAAANGGFYLAAISTRPDIPAATVSGLGLTWTLVKAQCSGRDNVTRVEVWMAQGIAKGDGPVTASFPISPSNAVIAVSRYSGVNATTPFGDVVSGNTNGQNGVCSGGIDSAAYSFDLNTMVDGSVAFGAASMPNTENIPGADYSERAEVAMGSGDQGASVTTGDILALSSTVKIDGKFSSNVDWAFIGLTINPGGDNRRLLPPPAVAKRSDAYPIADSGVPTLTPGNAGSSDLTNATIGAPLSTTKVTAGNEASDNDTTSDTLPLSRPDDGNNVTFEEIQRGKSSDLASVTTDGNLKAVASDLYLVAISTRKTVEVASVTGLGLTWTPVLTPLAQQCSGRNSTNVVVLMARGATSGDGSVTATFDSAPSNAVIVVSRYSGVDGTTPIGEVVSGNSNGLSGACSRGTDSAAYSFNLSTVVVGSVGYGAVAMRNKTHTTAMSFNDRAEQIWGSGGQIVSLATGDMLASTPTVSFVGRFSSDVDWAFIGLIINPSRNGTKPLPPAIDDRQIRAPTDFDQTLGGFPKDRETTAGKPI